MRMKRRLLSLLLCAALLFSLCPQIAVFAVGTDTGKTIQLGTSGISAPTPTQDSSGTYYTPSDYVYLGVNNSSPIKWRVLDADKANDGTTDGIFMLSEYLLADGVSFNETDSNTYQGSDAQTWCSNFAANTDNFSLAEQNAMKGVAKKDEEGKQFNYEWGKSELTEEDKMFCLSVEELVNYVGNYQRAEGLLAKFEDGTNNAYGWWLRSPSPNTTYQIGFVHNVTGSVSLAHANGKNFQGNDGNYTVRPACNLDRNSILFTSAAAGGKSASGMDTGMAAVNDYDGNEWKLTLRDDSRDFAVTETSISGEPGDAVTLNYTGAVAGTNEYISAIIQDKASDEVLYYGRVAQPVSAAGSLEITIPAELAAGSYILNVFSEQYNGDYKTDYASAFQQVDLAVSGKEAGAPTITTQPQDGTYSVGDTADAISVEANVTDGGTLSYQWYSNTIDSNSGGTRLEGETNSSYTPDISAEGTTYYYCVVTNTLNGTTAETVSATAKIEVTPVVYEYDVYIYEGDEWVGTRVTSENADDVLQDGGTVSYDASTCTLTLDNAKIAGILTYGNERKTLTINVVGECTVESQRYNAVNLQASTSLSGTTRVYNKDKLVITGDGHLSIKALSGSSTAGITAYDDVTIDGANVDIIANGIAIAVQEQTGPAGDDPYQGGTPDLNIIDSTVTATTNGSATNAIWTESGGMKINNSDVTVNAKESSYPTLWAATGIEIENGSKVTATTDSGNVFYSIGGIKVDGSTVTAKGETSYSPAMYADSVEITGKSDVTATSGGNAIYVGSGGISIDDSIVKADAVGKNASYAIYVYEGDVTVTNGSDVTVKSTADSAVVIEDGDMSVTGSTITDVGTDYEGIIIGGAFSAKDSLVNVSRTTESNSPAIIAEQLKIEASEITADGGIEFYNWFTSDTDNIAFSITPASGKLMELKVDDANSDGSAAVHFNNGVESPYDKTVNFDVDAMNALSDYKYVRIGEHIHAGGTATCTDPAVCDDCGRTYGDVDPDNHSFTNYVYNNDATYTANGTETAKCDRCGATDTREKAGSMLKHNAEKTEVKAEADNSPQTGDNSNLTLWFALVLVSGASVAAVAVYSRRKKREH